jgi:hypothetical protein
LEKAVSEGLRKKEPEFYQKGISKLLQMWEKLMNVSAHFVVKWWYFDGTGELYTITYKDLSFNSDDTGRITY